MDAGAVQRFAGVDIAKPGNRSLVEQQRLDRPAPPLEPALEPSAVGRAECVGAEFREGRPFVERIGGNEIDRAEPSRIVECEGVPVVGFEQQMVVDVGFGRVNAPMARHAEVKNPCRFAG